MTVSIQQSAELVELLVYDEPQACPYLPDRVARMPLRLPTAALQDEQLDKRLAAGDRRSGSFLYRTKCPTCQACEPLRVVVDSFVPSRTQSRVFRRGEQQLQCQLGQPTISEHHVRLYNKHRAERGLTGSDGEITEHDYERFLLDTCCDSFEIRYSLDGCLVAVAICDRGLESLSAVYCHFDPKYSRLSLGTYSILKQIEFCLDWGMKYLYLGLYIAESPHMSYKANFLSHQRLIDEQWKQFDRR